MNTTQNRLLSTKQALWPTTTYPPYRSLAAPHVARSADMKWDNLSFRETWQALTFMICAGWSLLNALSCCHWWFGLGHASVQYLFNQQCKDLHHGKLEKMKNYFSSFLANQIPDHSMVCLRSTFSNVKQVLCALTALFSSEKIIDGSRWPPGRKHQVCIYCRNFRVILRDRGCWCMSPL